MRTLLEMSNLQSISRTDQIALAPTPPISRLRDLSTRKKGWKMLSRQSAGMPGPVSACLLYTSHGGSVTVESSSENGTTFAVTLPLAQPC